jgi:uncharacterized protein YdaU (DUF1376 family)
MSKQPFMPLFFGDLLGSTGEWRGEEVSLYLTLLGYEWSIGDLPSEPDRLATLVRWDRKLFDRCWAQVSEKFVLQAGRLVNPRLEEHRERAREISAKNAESGKRGAELRWRKNAAPHKGTNGDATMAATSRGARTPPMSTDETKAPRENKDL